MDLYQVGGITQLIDPENVDRIKNEIIEEFRHFIMANNLEDFKLLDELRFVTRDVRKTIAVMCEFPGGNEFFKHLEKRFGKSIPAQPFHITIMSLEPEVGISISSRHELEETEPIDLPELNILKKHKINPR